MKKPRIISAKVRAEKRKRQAECMAYFFEIFDTMFPAPIIGPISRITGTIPFINPDKQ